MQTISKTLCFLSPNIAIPTRFEYLFFIFPHASWQINILLTFIYIEHSKVRFFCNNINMQAYLVLHVLSAQSMSFPSLKTDQRFHLQHFDEICYNNVANILTKYVTLPNRLRPTNDDFVTVFFTCYDYYCLSP